MEPKPAVPYGMTQIVKESQRRIKKALAEGFEYDHIVIAKSDQFLRTHVSQKLDFAVMYIDMVGSTRMSTKLEPDFLSRIVTVFSREVSYVWINSNTSTTIAEPHICATTH